MIVKIYNNLFDCPNGAKSYTATAQTMKQKAFFSRNATRLQDYERKLSPHSKDSLETKINPRTVKLLITEPRFTWNIQRSDNRSNI